MVPKWETLYDKEGIVLVRGDSREYLPTLEKESAALLLSDPPYGHNNNDGDLIHQLEKAIPARRNKRDYDKISEERRSQRKDVNYTARPIANDGVEANELVKWIISESKRLLIKGGNIALCCSGGGGPGTIEYANWSLWMDQVLSFKQMIIWDKHGLGIGWHYRRNYEVVLVATKPGAACLWYDETDRIPNVIGARQGIRKIIPSEDQHPCEKPVGLAEFFIKLHTKPGDLVIDPCAGAGWVGVACKSLARNYIGVEIDPHWAEQAAKKLEKFQGGVGLDLEKKKLDQLKKDKEYREVVNKGFGVDSKCKSK